MNEKYYILFFDTGLRYKINLSIVKLVECNNNTRRTRISYIRKIDDVYFFIEYVGIEIVEVKINKKQKKNTGKQTNINKNV